MDLLFSIFLLLISVFGSISILWNLIIALKSYRWEEIEGVIYKSKKDSSFGWLGSNLVHTENANLKYRYRVNGKKYTNDRISAFGVLGISGNIPSQIIQKYPKGKRVKIYYNPEAPERSCLEPGIGITNPFTILILIMGITLLFFVFQEGISMFLKSING